MSTFNGIVKEFPRVQIDNFRLYEDHQPPLACFLSHVHSDHLTGLESFHSPFIYCTAPTRELLLKLEKFPHRMNFSKGILEARKQTYRKIKRLLKPIPLETPTEIELTPGYLIQVTLFDANHCTGACMFLIEGDRKAILYTGDIRSEPWWVTSIVRNPIMIPYNTGLKRLDNIYLDTTFAMGEALKMRYPTKAEGLGELLAKVNTYPRNTVFYVDAWTFGYEDVWIALSKALDSKIHLCDYRYRVYSSMRTVPECLSPHSASLLGFQLGNSYHEGCLTNKANNVRLHSCEKGDHCGILKDPNVVRITPIVTRYQGVEIAELGVGGGQGDLDQVHELEIQDVMAVAQLIALCGDQLKGQPKLHLEVVQWLEKLVTSGRSAVKLDFEGFWSMLRNNDDDEDILDDIPLDRLVPALAKLVIGKSEVTRPDMTQSKRITFPYSRHSSFEELRCLVGAFRPRDVHPCTVDQSIWTQDVSMKTLFGDLCSADVFWHDQLMLIKLKGKMALDSISAEQRDEESDVEIVTPSRKRGRPHVHRASDASTVTPTPCKTAKSTIPHISDEGSWNIRSSLPGDEVRKRSNIGVVPRKTHHNHGASINGGTMTPAAQTRTPSSTASSAYLKSRDRVARRAHIAGSMRDGVVWEGLRSVKGYHNQPPEEEL